MNKMMVGTGLIGFACLLGMVGCESEEAAMQPISGGSSVSSTVEAAPETTLKAHSGSLEAVSRGSWAIQMPGQQWSLNRVVGTMTDFVKT